MIYSNDNPRAVLAMEIERTANYGEYGIDEQDALVCPVCGLDDAETFYINDMDICIGCSECVHTADSPIG